MKIELKELTPDDYKNTEFYETLQEIGKKEYGFTNDAFNLKITDFPDYLKKCCAAKNNYNTSPAKDGPQTLFWLLINNFPVGIGKLRYQLNNNIEKSKGNIGYAIRHSQRNKGYGKILLKELLKKIKETNVKEILIICKEKNIASRKIIEANNGKLKGIYKKKCQYWIKYDQ